MTEKINSRHLASRELTGDAEAAPEDTLVAGAAPNNNLFGWTDWPAADDASLIGIAVEMPTPCPRCQGVTRMIGPGAGPHKGALMCACGRHCGWISTASFNFVEETVRRFGRPTKPILVRTPTDSGDSKTVHNQLRETNGYCE